MLIKVKDFMRAPVITTVKDSPVAYVRELMDRKGVNAIPIVAMNGAVDVEGIVTSSDLLFAEDDDMPVRKIMTKKILSVTRDTDAQTAARLMLDKDIHHLLVIEDDHIQGIISAMDFVRLVAKDPSVI